MIWKLPFSWMMSLLLFRCQVMMKECADGYWSGRTSYCECIKGHPRPMRIALMVVRLDVKNRNGRRAPWHGFYHLEADQPATSWGVQAPFPPQSERLYYTIHMKISNQLRSTLSLLCQYSVVALFFSFRLSSLSLVGWDGYEAGANSLPHFFRTPWRNWAFFILSLPINGTMLRTHDNFKYS